MNQDARALADLLDARIEDYLANEVKKVRSYPGYDDRFLKQAHRGFCSVVRAAIDGDLGPRDQYVEGVIAGVRDRGLTASELMSALVETGVIFAAWATANGAEASVPWLSQFMGSYAEVLAKAFEE